VLKPEQWDEYFAFEYQDLNKYKKIHHFGDIHGCFEPLNEYLKDGIKDDEFYIFVGDYIDRGIQNAEVLEYLFTIKGRSNVVMLEGNHEFPLRKWAKNSTTNSEIFNVYTKKEIEKKNISKKKVNLILSTLKTFFAYEYDEKKVLVNHGGITKIPKTKYEIPAEQMIRGVGNYEFNVDGAFTENSNENEYQLHGHRNIYKVPSFASKNSYNLEFGVEKGGCLRVMTLNNKGFESIEIKNNVFSDRYENKKEIKCSSK
jgi:predicted MPP superfamily phosphohydrolase